MIVLHKDEMSNDKTVGKNQSILLVTAHPDDEVMFFTPLLLKYNKRQKTGNRSSMDGDAAEEKQSEFHILCLSTGNYEGLGSIRSAELVKCAAMFDIPDRCVTIVDDPLLPDSMSAVWPEEHIAEIVSEKIDAIKPEAIYTFDEYGVSGHPNHIATYRGVRLAIQRHTRSQTTIQQHRFHSSKPVHGWKLRSRSVFRKFLGVFDLFITALFCRSTYTVINVCGVFFALNGMFIHNSQNAVYRQCFVLLSCFSYFNEFERIS